MHTKLIRTFIEMLRDKTCRRWLPTTTIIILCYFLINVHFYEKNEFSCDGTPGWPIYLQPSYGSQLLNYNTSELSKEEKEFVEDYMPVMLDRLKVIGNYCNKHPEYSEVGFSPHLAWIVRKNVTPDVLWCSNVKVGSGTWVANFLRIVHFNEKNPLILALPPSEREKARFEFKYGASYRMMARYFPSPRVDRKKVKIFSNALRFLVVRHPFTRILSSYRNKIEMSLPNAKDEESFKELRKDIIRQYRQKSDNTTDENPHPTFPEFVRYLIDSTKSLKSPKDWNSKVSIYWQPFWAHCHVCASDYTVVVKLETMPQDERFIAVLAKIEELKQKKKTEWRHVINKKTSFELVDEYYKLLSKKEMIQLYKAFQPDFDLFQYDIKEYLRLANDS